MEEVCMVCGSVGFNDGGDGFFYCGSCDSQVEGRINACIDDEDLFNEAGIYSQRRSRPQPPSQSQPSYIVQPKPGVDDAKLADGVGPTGPSDFGWCPENLSYEDYYKEVRRRYVMGFQIMLQVQSKALVDHFNVSPNIIDLHNPIWLRLLACTGVMADDWADKVLLDSEMRNVGEVTESQRSAKHTEPQNLFGQRAVMIWFRSLRHCLPLSYTLALSFLFCHVAEEPILPTDILKGVLEGKIPYFSAFVDIRKQLESTATSPRASFPISCSVMFRPTQIISLQELEATSVCISEKIGLELRPLNFNALTSRYLKELSIPVLKILPLATRIYEWSMPGGIYLSSNQLKLPSRVCLMSILVVAIRIYYNINGFGKWESSTTSTCRNLLPRDKLNDKEKHTFGIDIGSDVPEEFVPDINSKDYEVHESDVVELLNTLYGQFNKLSELHDTFEHYKDLPSYLKFCKDCVFAGVEPLSDDYKVETLMEDLWKYYERDFIVQETPLAVGSHQNRTVSSLKRDMEDNKFVYLPPRSNAKKDDHMSYSRKKSNGAYVYAVHGDYYILLRSCAKACQVDVRTMHIGVLTFERVLQERGGQDASKV